MFNTLLSIFLIPALSFCAIDDVRSKHEDDSPNISVLDKAKLLLDREDNSVVKTLVEKREEYQILSKTSDLDFDSYSTLISGIDIILDNLIVYEDAIGSNIPSYIGLPPVEKIINGCDYNEISSDDCWSTIGALLAMFNYAGYDMCFELLTESVYRGGLNHSYSYIPTTRGRIYSSHTTYDCLTGSASSGDATFLLPNFDFDFQNFRIGTYDNNTNRNQEDLGLAIHSFSYSINRSVATCTFSDRYDYQYVDTFPYAPSNSETIMNNLSLIMLRAKNEFQIRDDYRIEFTFDINESLYPSIRVANSLVQVNLENHHPSNVILSYTDGGVTENSGLHWTGIVNTCSAVFQQNSTLSTTHSVTVGFETTLSFSYIFNGLRYILSLYFDLADGLFNPNVSLIHKIVDSANGISICGKRSGGWIFQFHNSLDCSVSFEYSTQMVTYAYASSWSGISDVSIIGVGIGSVVMFQVDEHVLCGFVSFRINYGSMSRYVYANELSTDCSWTHFSRDENNDDYLSIENMGKTNNRWCLRIGNPKSFRLQVTYNSKMCFGTDARDWSGLNDQVNLAVGARSFAVVYVSTNLFAGYVTACYCDLNGRRFVTYANSLTQSGGITVYHNVI